MPPLLATVVFAFGILGLFALNRDPKARTSRALWIPVIWLSINGSRPVSQWLQLSPAMDSPDSILEGSPLDAQVYAILVAAGLIVMVARGRQVGTFLRANGPLLAFFLYAGISVLWSDYPFVAFKRWTKGVGDLIMVLIVLTDADRNAAIARLLDRTSILLLPVSILLIKYYPDLGRGYDRWEGKPIITGVTTNKNLLGVICLVLGIGALWRFLRVYRSRESIHRRQPLIAQGVILALVLWLLWISNSMTSLASFLLAGSLIVVTSRSALARKRSVVHRLVLVVLFVPLSALFLGASGVLGAMGRDSTLTGRTEIWSLLLPMAENPLFGTGYESFWLGKRLETIWSWDYYFRLNEAHNGYIEVFLNLGWVGIIMLAVLMVSGYRDIVNSLKRDSDAARLRLAYLVAAAIYGLTEAGFRMMSPVQIAFLFAVTVVPMVGSEGRNAVTGVLMASEADNGHSSSTTGERVPPIARIHSEELTPAPTIP